MLIGQGEDIDGIEFTSSDDILKDHSGIEETVTLQIDGIKLKALLKKARKNKQEILFKQAQV